MKMIKSSSASNGQNGVIDQKNVGVIAARIVANELEFRRFRVTDLNKDGFSANVDLLAARDGRVVQIQVKGASQLKKQNGWEDWWVGYGYANPEVIAKRRPMFNRVADGCYQAEIVALIAVRTPVEYCCVLLPLADAERAAQVNLDRDYRTLTLKRKSRSPNGKVWVCLDQIPKTRDPARRPQVDEELRILKAYKNNWNI